MRLSSNPIDVCVIEDDAVERRFCLRILEKAGYRAVDASNAASGFEAIKAEHPKVIICDYNLPDRDGLSLCSELRNDAAVSESFFILITAENDALLRQQAWAAGVDDYISKPFDSSELVARVKVGQRMWGLQERLRAAAVTDGLTRLWNHDHFNRLLDRELSRARRYGRPLALIVLDIDHFKAINDTFGHLAGNEVLEELAGILRDNARDVDSVCRFGGEEFVILLPESTSTDAEKLAARIQHAVSETLHVEALGDHPVTASFGIADTEDARVQSAADLVDLADRAMYAAKRRGRNRVVNAASSMDGEETPLNAASDHVESLQKRIAVLKALARDVYGQSITCLGQALVEKDPYTARHSVNVCFYAGEIARQLGCASGTVKSISNAGLLHDVGKVGIPDSVLLKRGPLGPIEHTIIAQVPVISTRIVECLRILESEVLIIRHQREHFDGSGVPDGLKSDQIPIGARVLLVADAFDAMTTDRVYRQRRSIEAALAELRDQAGTQFDPRVVLALEQVVARDLEAWQARVDESVDLFQLPALDS